MEFNLFETIHVLLSYVKDLVSFCRKSDQHIETRVVLMVRRSGYMPCGCGSPVWVKPGVLCVLKLVITSICTTFLNMERIRRQKKNEGQKPKEKKKKKRINTLLTHCIHCQ